MTRVISNRSAARKRTCPACLSPVIARTVFTVKRSRRRGWGARRRLIASDISARGMSDGFQFTPQQREHFAEEVYAGRKINAIRQLRELSGLDLKESKEVIDGLEAELRAAHPDRFAARTSNAAS